ncbi:fructose-bisphosphatase class II, partial [Enterobacter hormaechei]
MAFFRVTPAAAPARYNWVGRGDKKNPDRGPVHPKRHVLKHVKIHWKILNCEREKQQTPNL